MDVTTNPFICDVSTQCAAAPTPQPTCPRKFDGGSFVGGMFLIVGVILLVAAGLVFYRKRKASTGSYEAL